MGACPSFILFVWASVCHLGAVPAVASSAADVCGGVPLSEWTSRSVPAKGYHLLCFDDSEGTCSSDGSACGSDGKLQVRAYWDASRVPEPLELRPPDSLRDLERALSEHREPTNKRRHGRIQKALEKKGQARGIFAFFRVPEGGAAPVKLTSANDLKGLVMVFEGGAFIWPGVEAGFERTVNFTVRHSDNLVLKLMTRSMQPVVVEVSGFLEESECNHVVNKATPHVKPSAVSHMDHDRGKADTNWRTSSTYFMRSDDDILRRLDWRVSALTLTGKDHQEPAQVLRYEQGQSYDSHTDYFDPDMYKQDQMVQDLTKKGLFNRLATVFFYLTTVEEGGETNFPRAGGKPHSGNFKDCSAGVSVRPEQGRIIIFYSQLPAGQLDPMSLHSGCPVRKGVKWSANKWIWNKPMKYTAAD